MGNTLLGGGTPYVSPEGQEVRMERLPDEVDVLLRGLSDEDLEQALARRRGTTDVYQTVMYHAELAPRGKDTTSDKIEALEAEGWVDNPAKFNKPKEEKEDAQRDERIHEQGREGGPEADGPDADPEGTALHDQGKDGWWGKIRRGGKDAGQGSGLLQHDDQSEQGQIDEDAADEAAKKKRKEDVYAAFAVLIEEADDDKFDANGQPRIDPLNDVLEFPEDDPQRVKTTERNRLWEVYRENLKKEVNKAD